MRDEMKRRGELADFLKTRRARLHPEQFGLPSVGTRRTPGLRRDEVAQLAGVGLSWYTWLEQGRDITVSDQVLESLVKTLQLDTEERNHLFLLARGSVPMIDEQLETDQSIAGHQEILDALGANPAYLIDQRYNVLAWNESACQVFGNYALLTAQERNLVWRCFMQPSYRQLYVNWEEAAQRSVMSFRALYDLHAGDAWFEQFVADLKQASPEFSALWSQHDVKWSCNPHHDKELNHPQLGRLIVNGATLISPDAPTLRLVVFTPRSPETALKFATLAQTEKSYALA
jgi:transcriptional regulator with XRE-family HTH domain